MIISLFGPDGVGKSTVAKALNDAGWKIFSGTGVASWPDQTWHNSLLVQGIDETSLDDEAHFLEKIRRAHQLARDLEVTHEKVVIDSDPFHKTIMHDYKKALPNKQAAQNRLQERFRQLDKIAGYTNQNHVHVHFQVDESVNEREQAKVLQERLDLRTNLAYFDPRSIEQSQVSIEAYRILRNLLETEGEKVITIFTDRPFVLEDFLAQVIER